MPESAPHEGLGRGLPSPQGLEVTVSTSVQVHVKLSLDAEYTLSTASRTRQVLMAIDALPVLSGVTESMGNMNVIHFR